MNEAQRLIIEASVDDLDRAIERKKAAVQLYEADVTQARAELARLEEERAQLAEGLWY